MTMREKLNTDLVLGTVSSNTFVPETSSGGNVGLLPLGYFMRKINSTDPTTGGNVGNISGSSHSWWRHVTAGIGANGSQTGNSFALNATTYLGIEQALKRTYNYTARGSGGAPNLVVFDQISYEIYESAMAQRQRYMDTRMADMGFDNIKLKGATCIWDEVTPDVYTGTAAIAKGTAFFINTNFYNLVIDSETDIVTTPFIEPENQTAKTAKVLFMGNATCSNLRKMGVAYDILTTIVA